jgi:ubiquinone/menaquinone biosynthesis C-methylase UbiE
MKGESPLAGLQRVKKATIAHWTGQPIGTRTAGFASPHPEFSKPWFEDNARFRYQVYAPWLTEAAAFPQHAGQRMLEIGCGLGADLAEFCRAASLAVGIDLTPRHVALTRRRLDLFGLRAGLAEADAEHLPFRDDAFHFVYSVGVLHHTPRIEQAIAEIHRVLRTGGSALIIVYHRHSIHFYLRIVLGRWLPERLRRLKRLDFRSFPIRETLNASTDGPTNPLTRVFSAREARDLCRPFREVRMRIRHLNPWDIPLGRLLPEQLRQSLAGRFGWYLLLEVRK